VVGFSPNPNLTSSADAFIISESIATGCVSQDAFVNLGLDVGDAVYLSEDGIHSLSMSQQYGNRDQTYLSWPIRKTFDRLNRSRLKYAKSAYWPNEGIVLFAVSTGANVVNDTILCLDIKNAQRLSPENVRWYVWRLNGATVNTMKLARGSDNKPYIYFGGNAGEVVRFDRHVYSDNGASISATFQTKNEDFGLPSREKHIGDVYIGLQGNGNYTVQHSILVDDGQSTTQHSLLEVPTGTGIWGTALWGQFTWGGEGSIKRHRVPGVGSGVTVSHRFSHSGASEPFWLSFLSQEIFSSGPADDVEANTVGS
jgi:hypothetical protein